MAIPIEGSQAPDFTVLTDEGKQVSLADYKGKTVVLYFYPVPEQSSFQSRIRYSIVEVV